MSKDEKNEIEVLEDLSGDEDLGNQKETLGELLKKARLDWGVPLETVASSTKVNINFLEAIEDDRLDKLPAKPYVKGFLRAYAKFLKLSADKLIQKYEEQLHELEEPPEAKKKALHQKKIEARKKSELLRFASSKPNEKSGSKAGLKAMGFAMLAMVFVAGGYALYVENKNMIFSTLHLSDSKKPREIETVPFQLISSPKSGFWSRQNLIQVGDLWRPFCGGQFFKWHSTVPQKSQIVKEEKSLEEALVQADESYKVDDEQSNGIESVATDESKNSESAVNAEENQSTEKKTPEQQVSNEKVKGSDELKISQGSAQGKLSSTHVVSLIAEKDSWVRYQEDRSAIREFTLKAGEKHILKGKNLIKIYTGNLPGLKIDYNGEPIQTGSGATVKSLVFPPHRLKEFSLPLFPDGALRKVDPSEVLSPGA